MTGDKDARMQLYYQLSRSLRGAESVDIIVSFLMESGVKMIVKDLENALKRGAKIRILTGNYLGITQPSALYMIKRELGEQIDLRFYNEKNRSFHPNHIYSIIKITVRYMWVLRIFQEVHLHRELNGITGSGVILIWKAMRSFFVRLRIYFTIIR